MIISCSHLRWWIFMPTGGGEGLCHEDPEVAPLGQRQLHLHCQQRARLHQIHLCCSSQRCATKALSIRCRSRFVTSGGLAHCHGRVHAREWAQQKWCHTWHFYSVLSAENWKGIFLIFIIIYFWLLLCIYYYIIIIIYLFFFFGGGGGGGWV